ncbi:MAG: hypothetical protein ACPKQO_02355 [Nitrososphaeraceae archaeon]
MDNKNFLFQQLKWISLYFAISFIISLIVPFPYSLVVIISVIIFLSFYVRRRQMQKIGSENMSSMFNTKKVNYYCMACGTKHDNIMCPKCGSKMKRIG